MTEGTDRRIDKKTFFNFLKNVNILQIIAICFLAGMVWQRFNAMEEKSIAISKDVGEIKINITEIKVLSGVQQLHMNVQDERLKYLERK